MKANFCTFECLSRRDDVNRVSGTFILKTIRSLEHSFPRRPNLIRGTSFPGLYDRCNTKLIVYVKWSSCFQSRPSTFAFKDQVKYQQATNKFQSNINEVLRLNDVRKSKNRPTLETKWSKMLNRSNKKLIVYVKWSS